MSVTGEMEIHLWVRWAQQRLRHTCCTSVPSDGFQENTQRVDHGCKSLCALSPACTSYVVSHGALLHVWQTGPTSSCLCPKAFAHISRVWECPFPSAFIPHFIRLSFLVFTSCLRSLVWQLYLQQPRHPPAPPCSIPTTLLYVCLDKLYCPLR